MNKYWRRKIGPRFTRLSLTMFDVVCVCVFAKRKKMKQKSAEYNKKNPGKIQRNSLKFDLIFKVNFSPMAQKNRKKSEKIDFTTTKLDNKNNNNFQSK